MPIPNRTRRKDGAWRRKRSDAGLSRKIIEFTPAWVGIKNGKELYGCTISEDESLLLYEVYDKSRNNEIINDFIEIGKECDLRIVDIKEIIELKKLEGYVTVHDKVTGRAFVLFLSNLANENISKGVEVALTKK